VVTTLYLCLLLQECADESFVARNARNAKIFNLGIAIMIET
jgi:hypothetical protein